MKRVEIINLIKHLETRQHYRVYTLPIGVKVDTKEISQLKSMGITFGNEYTVAEDTIDTIQ